MNENKKLGNLSNLCETGYVTTHVTIPTKILDIFEQTYNKPCTPSFISDLLDDYDKKLIKNEWKNKHISRRNYFLDIILEEYKVSIDDEKITTKRSVRMCQMDWDFISTVMSDKPISNNKFSDLACFIGFLIYTKEHSVCLDKHITCMSQPTLAVLGNKYWLKEWFIRILEELINVRTITKTVELFGGSGTQTCFTEEYYKDNRIPSLEHIYNDKQTEKINFMKQLKGHAKDLRKKCKLLISAYNACENKESFHKSIQAYCENNKHNTISTAAAFWFLALFNKKDFRITRVGSLEEFVYTSSLLQNTTFTNNDVFYCLKKYQKDKQAFIVVDPPYLDTDGYINEEANADFPEKEHERLCAMLLQTKGIWIYHGRVLPSKSIYTKDNPQDFENRRKNLIRFWKRAFLNKGVFYLDVPYQNTLERIVSNYPFDGFKPYVEEPYSSFLDNTDEEVIVSSVENADEEMIVPSVENAVEEMVASSVEDIKEEMTVPSTENTDEEITTSSVENVVEEMTISPVENADEKANISPSVEDTGKEVTISSIETATEETTIETPVHTEPSSVEEIITDTHKPVVKKKRKKKRKKSKKKSSHRRR